MPRITIPPEFWQREAETLTEIAAPHLVETAQAGVRAGASALAGAGGDIDWALVNARAAARARAMTIKIADEVMVETREAIAAWIEEGAPLAELVERLETDIHFSEARAARIAATEVTRAYAEGNLAAWRESGAVAGKRWETAVDELVCPYCGPLHGQEVALDALFTPRHRDTGETLDPVDGPPAHVNCRCYPRPVIRRGG